MEYFQTLHDTMHLFHLNILLLLGLALFGGLLGGRIFQKLRTPQVVGYIIIGILIGESGFDFIDATIIEVMSAFNYFALGLIGFMVGGELRKEIFQKYGRHFFVILLWEGITPFFLVSISIVLIGGIFWGYNPTIFALAILLGAISSATDPASTTSVLKEYKTRGPLTTTVLGIVALDDGLALLLFAVASSVAGALIGSQESTVLASILEPLYEIIGAVIVGAVAGFILSQTIRRYPEKERILAFSIGMVLLVTGVALTLKVSMLLAAMMMGVILANYVPRHSDEAFRLVEAFSPPIYVLFFVMVGAQLKFSHLTVNILVLVTVYLIFGLSGKMLGAYVGAKVSRSAKTVVKYLPFALFSQAGVAIGLSILAAQYFPGEIGHNLIVIITTTTFATQLLGPTFTKLAVSRGKEIGLNIDEDDIIKNNYVSAVMDANPPQIRENMYLSEILQIFSENVNLYYPVVSLKGDLHGIVTVEGIKQSLLYADLGGLILAHDLMQPVIATTTPGTLIVDAKKILDVNNIDYLPVIDDNGRLSGFMERKMLDRYVSTRLIELQKKIEHLESRVPKKNTAVST
ncbi:cation:proton antiporter [bacterium]|nr:cation:proton antiporter [bacterium]